MNNTTTDHVTNVTRSQDEENESTIKVTVVIMLSIFSVVGVIGNAIAFYIFFRRRATSTSVIFILALAGTDFITCLVTIPYTVVFELLRYNLVFDLACKTYMFLITSTVPFSAYIMVGIALDRYFCICHPFLYVFTIPRAKAVILCMGIPALVFGTITALSHGTYIYDTTIFTTEQNKTTAMKEFGRSEQDILTDSDFNRDLMAKMEEGKFVMINNTTNVTARHVIKHYGLCVYNHFIFSGEFLEVYKKIHALNFLLAYLAVAALYILIYKSIFTRRANKARRKKNNIYSTTGSKVKGNQPEETQMTIIIGGEQSSPKFMNNQSRKEAKCGRKIKFTDWNDASSLIKSEDRQTCRNVKEEAKEDEITNLLNDGDDGMFVAATESTGNMNTSNRALNAQKPRTDYGDLASCVYLGPAPDLEPFNLEQKSKGCDGSSRRGSKDEMLTESSPLQSNDGKRRFATSDTAEVYPSDIFESNKDEANVGTLCDDRRIAEEKPLLLISPRPQFPAVPPTSLSLRMNKLNATSSSERTKSLNTESMQKTAMLNHTRGNSKERRPASSPKRKRPSTVRDRNLIANIKTAFMLFIVTLVFIIAFLPALLMANELIPLNLIVFYGYFIYNVANPFIYAFMNQTFREDLKKLINVCK